LSLSQECHCARGIVESGGRKGIKGRQELIGRKEYSQKRSRSNTFSARNIMSL
jgi:hypothetical protein